MKNQPWGICISLIKITLRHGLNGLKQLCDPNFLKEFGQNQSINNSVLFILAWNDSW